MTNRRNDPLSSTVSVGDSLQDASDLDVHFSIEQHVVAWTVQYRLNRKLGEGRQGIVYLADRLGMDVLTVPVALKFFSPVRYADLDAYKRDMARVARIAARVTLIQQDNLVDVHNFVEFDDIHVMAMEWVDGYDLRFLLRPAILRQIQDRVEADRWAYLNDVVLTAGPVQPRVKPGIAIAIVRECLAGLGALHRGEVVHGDIKPSNIMLKRTGNTKIIDLGSAFLVHEEHTQRPFTPQYAAPEVLAGQVPTVYSDLASLGYVLAELLAGQPPFAGVTNYDDLRATKLSFEDELQRLLPPEVLASQSLLSLIQTLTQPDPEKRFQSAEAADLLEYGAASFQRELVAGNLASEYATEIRLWLEELE